MVLLYQGNRCCPLRWLPIWLCFIHCHIFMQKNSFLLRWNSCKQRSESSTRCCFWSTVRKCSTHFQHSFLIDKCSSKMVNTLPSDIFNSSAISINFNLWSAKTSLWRFCIFWDNCRIWATWAHSIICVCTTAFKVSIPSLNRCFWRSRFRITLIKPLLCLNSIFSPIRKQHRKFRFFHWFENLQQ